MRWREEAPDPHRLVWGGVVKLTQVSANAVHRTLGVYHGTSPQSLLNYQGHELVHWYSSRRLGGGEISPKSRAILLPTRSTIVCGVLRWAYDLCACRRHASGHRFEKCIWKAESWFCFRSRFSKVIGNGISCERRRQENEDLDSVHVRNWKGWSGSYKALC